MNKKRRMAAILFKRCVVTNPERKRGDTRALVKCSRSPRFSAIPSLALRVSEWSPLQDEYNQDLAQEKEISPACRLALGQPRRRRVADAAMRVLNGKRL